MRAAAATCLAAFALAGCDGGDEPPARVAGDAQRAAAAVERLERALAGGDFGAVCERLFSRGLRERLGGGRCPRMLREAARGIRRPRIAVEAVSLQGSRRAEVRVVTTSERQAPVRDLIVLVKEGGSYRVDGLGTTAER